MANTLTFVLRGIQMHIGAAAAAAAAIHTFTQHILQSEK